MFADPAEARLFTQRFFQHRGRVGECPECEGRFRRGQRDVDLLSEFGQSSAQHLVVIATQGVARNVRLVAVFQHLYRLSVCRQILHARGDDSTGVLFQQRWTKPFLDVAL